MRIYITVLVIAIFLLAAIMDDSSAQGTPGYGDNVFAGVKTEQKTYSVGEPVKIDFVVQNRSNAPVTYNFSSGKQYDMAVEKGGKEVWRLSHGRMYTQALTKLTLAPQQTRTFSTTWNQTNDNGKAVGPGTYTVKAQLTPMNAPGVCSPGGTITCVSTQITIGTSKAKVTPTTVSAIVGNVQLFKGKLVTVNGTFRGWKADGNAPACKMGPPISRSDWAIADKTGCIYAYGRSGLDPVRDVGVPVTILARVMVTKSGQPYLEVRNVQVVGK